MAATIRRLKPTDQDLAQIAAGLNAADSEVTYKTFTAESLREFVADDRRFYLIATTRGRIAGMLHGYCLLHPSGVKIVYIDEVDTVAQYRRNGVATALMRAAFGVARDYGAAEAWLGTEHDNTAAIALYEGLHPSETDNGPIYTYKIEAKKDA
jgi:ribosomal protein S18 acetylase RimI-like enzyme